MQRVRALHFDSLGIGKTPVTYTQGKKERGIKWKKSASLI